jgi:hypothetical protein
MPEVLEVPQAHIMHADQTNSAHRTVGLLYVQRKLLSKESTGTVQKVVYFTLEVPVH